MTLHHPLADGVALGVVASLLAAFGVAWIAARKAFGPSRHHRRHKRHDPLGAT